LCFLVDGIRFWRKPAFVFVRFRSMFRAMGHGAAAVVAVVLKAAGFEKRLRRRFAVRADHAALGP
jgi:hypothetical protein